MWAVIALATISNLFPGGDRLRYQVYTILVAVLVGLTPQDADANAKAALAFAAAQNAAKVVIPASPVPPSLPPPKPREPTYQEACDRAVKENKPLIVGVRCDPVVPAGCIGHREDFADEDTGIIVGVPVRGIIKRIQRRFGPNCTIIDVRNAVEEFRNPPPVKKVSRSMLFLSNC